MSSNELANIKLNGTKTLLIVSITETIISCSAFLYEHVFDIIIVLL